MKTIEITNQKEWDALPDSFKEETEIIITGEIYEITHKENALFYIVEKAKIQGVWGNATVQRVGGNATVKIFSSSATIKKALQECVIIYQDCTPNLPKNVPNLIRTKGAVHTIESFAEFYEDLVKGTKMTLYKSVNPETECDFYTGRIHYKDGATVRPEHFDPSNDRECGDGLHLSPTPEMALSYNKGKVKVCKVAIKDIVVYSENITKVRCAKVKVIGDYKA